MEERKITIPKAIILIIVVGLISLIPYAMIKSMPEEDKIVTKDNNFELMDLSYKIPEGFKMSSYQYDDYKSYSYGEDSIHCSITFDVSKNYHTYKTGEEYIRRRVMFTLDDTVSEITEENNWYQITRTSKSGEIETTAVYLGEENTYNYTFRMHDYSNGENIEKEENNKCLNAYDYTFKSLTMKAK